MGCETVRSSAQVIPVRKSTPSSLEVFVGYRTTNSFRHQWCSPGGNIDIGENTLAAGVRELYEETGALVWADQLEFLRTTMPNTRERIYRVDSFLLDATKEDLVNASPDEHRTMLWQDIGVLMRQHRAKVEAEITKGTVPPRLAETFAILESLQREPLQTLAERVREGYARLAA